MKSKPQSEEYRRFETLLGRVLSVSKADLKREEADSKKEKRPARVASRDSGVSSREH